MNIGRKISILALTGLLPVAAMAQMAMAQAADAPKAAEAPKAVEAAKSSVTVYGTLNLNMQSTEATGSTTTPATSDVKSRMALSNDSSNIGVRASLKVNDMIGGVAQCETTAAVSGVGTSPICNRNSRLGLTGDWGALFYGNWDTPYKAAAYGTKADDPFGNTDVYDAAGLMTSPGFSTKTGSYLAATPATGATTGGVATFTIRAQNSVAYHSPKFMGLSAKLQYAVDMYKNNTGTIDPSLFSAVLNYEIGPASVFATYEVHNDGYGLVAINGGTARQFGATVANNVGTTAAAAHSNDTGLRAGAGYELVSPAGATTLGVVVEQLSYRQAAAPTGAVYEYKRLGWMVGLKHRYEDHELRFRYNSNEKGDVKIANGTGSTVGYGATMLTVGYAYYIAPSLQVYGYYAKITNERLAQYTFGTGGDMPTVMPAGADPSAIGLGARYAF
jgi:predicted porin